jgi:ApaG protein
MWAVDFWDAALRVERKSDARLLLSVGACHIQTMIELKSVPVEVVNLVHSPDEPYQGEPAGHAFAYHIRITNASDQRVVLTARKWVLAFADGRHEVYEGDRIVGRIVDLSVGEAFEYSSYHLVSEDCEVSGAYFGYREDGQAIWLRIPKFQLHIPSELL